jgi:Flp pilus assembly protein CpaB
VKITPWMLTIATFSIVCTLAAGYMLKLAFGRAPLTESPRTTRTIPMLQTDVEPGTVITRAHIGMGPWDRSKTLEPDTMLNSDTIINRISKEKITAATPLRGSMFYAPGDFPELDIAEGKRAVVVRVSPTTAALNAKLKPGQYVDVQLTVDEADVSAAARRRAGLDPRSDTLSGDAMTATLFKGVKVVQVNRSSPGTPIPTAAGSQSVTLELDEEQSRIALLAQKKGEIDLIYSNNGPGKGGINIEASEDDRIFFMEILGLKSVAREENKPYRTEQYRGPSFNSQYFEDGQRMGNPTGPRTAPAPPNSSSIRGPSTTQLNDNDVTLDDLAGNLPADSGVPR